MEDVERRLTRRLPRAFLHRGGASEGNRRREGGDDGGRQGRRVQRQSGDAGMLARLEGVERVCFVGVIKLIHPPLAVTMVTPWQRPGALPEKSATLLVS